MQCSVTCGGGVERRYVDCVSMDPPESHIGTDVECEETERPESEKNCFISGCDGAQATWRIGPWGTVSRIYFLNLILFSLIHISKTIYVVSKIGSLFTTDKCVFLLSKNMSIRYKG